MGLILYIISILLRTILVTAAMIYNIIKLFKESHFGRAFRYADNSFLAMATAIDKYGNVVCAPMFNDLLVRRGSNNYFGNISQTISIVLGLNYLTGTLSPTGLFINNALNYFWRDHTVRAATGVKEKPAETSQFILDLRKIKNLIIGFLRSAVHS